MIAGGGTPAFKHRSAGPEEKKRAWKEKRAAMNTAGSDTTDREQTVEPAQRSTYWFTRKRPPIAGRSRGNRAR